MKKMFTKKASAEEQNSEDCSDCDKFVDSLQLILDGEASQEEKQFFERHLDECTPCLDQYNIEKNLLDAIREKMKKKACPEEVISTIRERISQETIS